MSLYLKKKKYSYVYKDTQKRSPSLIDFSTSKSSSMWMRKLGRNLREKFEIWDREQFKIWESIWESVCQLKIRK